MWYICLGRHGEPGWPLKSATCLPAAEVYYHHTQAPTTIVIGRHTYTRISLLFSESPPLTAIESLL